MCCLVPPSRWHNDLPLIAYPTCLRVSAIALLCLPLYSMCALEQEVFEGNNGNSKRKRMALIMANMIAVVYLLVRPHH